VAAPPPACASTCLACVADRCIDPAEARIRFEGLDPLVRRQTKAGPSLLLDALIDEALVVEEAERLKLHKRPEIAAELARSRARILTKALLARNAESMRLGEEQLKAHFAAHRARFQRAEQLTAIHVALKAGAARHWTRAQELQLVDALRQEGATVASIRASVQPDGAPWIDQIEVSDFTPDGPDPSKRIHARLSLMSVGSHTAKAVRVGRALRYLKLLKKTVPSSLDYAAVKDEVRADLVRSTRWNRWEGLLRQLKSRSPVTRHADAWKAFRTALRARPR
jgi:hypothetical protein